MMRIYEKFIGKLVVRHTLLRLQITEIHLVNPTMDSSKIFLLLNLFSMHPQLKNASSVVVDHVLKTIRADTISST